MIHPWMQGTIIVEAAVVEEPVVETPPVEETKKTPPVEETTGRRNRRDCI